MEWLDIVDESGIPTGEVVSREAAHFLGTRHRTAHVWVLRRREGLVEVLLQKRSEIKDSYPGCLDLSSAGHIPAGAGFLESALRELEEELGIAATREELTDLGLFLFAFEMDFHGRRFKDDQVSRIYILWRDVDPGDLNLQEEEITEVLWMDLEQCLEMVVSDAQPHCIRLAELKRVMGYAKNMEREG